MLDFYVWNPRIKGKPEKGSLAGIATSIAQGGNVGHMSLAVTLYENTHDLKTINSQFKELEFYPAPLKYEEIKMGEKKGVMQYKRGKKLKGLSAFLSLWPKESLSRVETVLGFFRLGGKANPSFYEKLQSDMNEKSPDPDRKIQHHYDESFKENDPSLRKKQMLEKKLEELKIKRHGVMYEIKLLIKNPTKSPLQERLEALAPPKTSYTVVPSNKLFYSDMNSRLKDLQSKNSLLASELKRLINTFHNLLLGSKIPNLSGYIEEYRKLTSEFNNLPTLFEDAPDAKRVKQSLISYLKYSGHEDAQELLVLIPLIEEKAKLYTDNQKDLVPLVKGERTLNSIDQQISNMQQEVKELEAEIENNVITQGLAPDHDVVLPTSESGQPFYLDELAILKKMESIKNDPKFKYDLFNENCARCVKDCIREGVSKDLENAILKLDNVPRNFFSRRFLESPFRVMEWVFKLQDYMNTLNSSYKLMPNVSPSLVKK